jgi:hypothetical protein
MDKADLERIDPDAELPDEEIEETKHMYLTNSGYKEMKLIQKASTRKFCFWTGAGLIGGVAASSSIKNLPFKKQLSLAKARKYRVWSFAFIFFPCTYHGYKLAVRDFKVQRRALYNNPEFCIEIDTSDTVEVDFD